MRVGRNRVVTVSYELYDNNPKGELLECMDARYPFVFLFGSGKLLHEFENQLEGLLPGDSFEFTLGPEKAYGSHDPKQVVEVPKENFRIDGELQEDLLIAGSLINLTAGDGTNHAGKVLRVKRKMVVVDLNHAMVDKTLFFSGVVLDVRDASIDEIIQGMITSGP
jgi:FKBP-type peptidyl-prolyl cis-trans isomerase SlyD